MDRSIHGALGNHRQAALAFGGIDALLLTILFLATILYRFETVTPWFPTFWIRAILYLVLYFRLIFQYRVRLNYLRLALFGFLAYACAIGVFTAVVNDPHLAFDGFLRFIGVALLAPLASVFLTTTRQVRCLMILWLGVVALAAVFMIYQFFGGNMDWLVQGYLAVRAGLVRFATHLGEPNVAGMAAAMMFAAALSEVFSGFWSVVLAVTAVVILFLSISKAALFGFVIVGLFHFIYRRRRLGALSRFQMLRSWVSSKHAKLAVLGVLPVLFIAVLFGSVATRKSGLFFRYFDSTIGAIVGHRNGEGVVDEMGAMDDIELRVLGMPSLGIQVLERESGSFPFKLVMGGGYSAAGSVAQERNGHPLPHDGYAEIFLVGGLLLLSLFLLIIALTLGRLRSLSRTDRLASMFFLIFSLTVLYCIGYPVIYEPITGAMFWTIVGLAGNSNLFSASPRKAIDMATEISSH